MTVWDEIGWVDPKRRETAILRLAKKLGSFDAPHNDRSNITTKQELSPAQLRTLEDFSHGLTAVEIAEKRFLSPWTVRSQMKVILRKLGAKNTVHAVSIAIRKGMIK